jgi:hypothetical protein
MIVSLTIVLQSVGIFSNGLTIQQREQNVQLLMNHFIKQKHKDEALTAKNIARMKMMDVKC